jgi:copper(I)-binding protein
VSHPVARACTDAQYGEGIVTQPGGREDAMPRLRDRPGRRPRLAAAALSAAALAATLGTAGCATSAIAGQAPAVQAATAYVPMPVTPGLTPAYLVIRNFTSHPDSLVSVRTSAGGRVIFQVPAAADGAQMRSVAAINLPANTTVRLVPDGPHLLISGIGPLRNGKVITLTLTFRHASAVRVPALVTDPSQSDGNTNYFMN